MFSRPPPSVHAAGDRVHHCQQASAGPAARGEENILQKLFSNATFEVGSGSGGGSGTGAQASAGGHGGFGRVQGSGEGNVVLDAVRRMGLGNGGGPNLRTDFVQVSREGQREDLSSKTCIIINYRIIKTSGRMNTKTVVPLPLHKSFSRKSYDPNWQIQLTSLIFFSGYNIGIYYENYSSSQTHKRRLSFLFFLL
jgi:hypothetical protein